MRDALEREAQRSVPHKSFAVEYKRVVEASTLHEAVPPKIFKLGREPERSCFRNYIIKSLACNIVRDILCADRRTRIIYHVAYAEFFRRNGGEKTFSSVLFEGYRRGKRAARSVAGDVAEAGFVYRLRKRKGAAVHYRDFSALQKNFNSIKFHTRYRCEHMFPGPHSDAVRKREAVRR